MLSAYVANRWAVEFNDANWHLSGDSGMGIPFFRALNAGFFSGSQLAYIVTREWLSQKNQRRAHNAVRPVDKLWEFTLAHGKNQAVQAYEAFKKANAVLPIEFNAWGREEIEEIQTAAQSRIILPGNRQP
ncbi:MAG: hypothetical protein JWO78_890 [Micavibrio sp.]|nr:hypothetical protein [Micavibrio sp.]